MKIYLVTRKSPFSFLIRFFTGSKISHVAISDISRDLVLQATLWDGLNFSHKKKFFETYITLYSFEFLPATSEQYDQVRQCYFRMMKLVDSPFDIGAIFGFIPYIIAKKLGMKTRKNWWGKPSAIYCSEALFIFLHHCIDDGIIPDILKNYTREEFSPQDALEMMVKFPSLFLKH